jgi:hypothetical protein
LHAVFGAVILDNVVAVIEVSRDSAITIERRLSQLSNRVRVFRACADFLRVVLDSVGVETGDEAAHDAPKH